MVDEKHIERAAELIGHAITGLGYVAMNIDIVDGGERSTVDLWSAATDRDLFLEQFCFATDNAARISLGVHAWPFLVSVDINDNSFFIESAPEDHDCLDLQEDSGMILLLAKQSISKLLVNGDRGLEITPMDFYSSANKEGAVHISHEDLVATYFRKFVEDNQRALRSLEIAMPQQSLEVN